jgi:hypothetical protein
MGTNSNHNPAVLPPGFLLLSLGVGLETAAEHALFLE